MVMPLCGTFRYAGVVPGTKAARESGQWQLEDDSGAAPLGEQPASTDDADLHPLRDNRLVGLRPTLRISGRDLVLEASGRLRSQMRSASLELDPSFIESFQDGDALTLIRTGTADIGVSIVRGGHLMAAAGAVTVIPLGAEVAVRGGPEVDSSAYRSERRLGHDTWVDVSVSGEVRRLRAGESTTIGEHSFSAVRCFQDGMPGTYECLAITFREVCPHEAALSSAKLLARPNAGLMMVGW